MTSQIVFAGSITPELLFYYAGEDPYCKINIQSINDNNYLFLPAEADTSNITLHCEDDDLNVCLFTDSEDIVTEELDLSCYDWSKNSAKINVVIFDKSGNQVSTPFTINIMRSSKIGAVYYTSDDSKLSGRVWIDSSKSNRGCGHIVIKDENAVLLHEGSVSDIHARGSSSFIDPKKSYQIKLENKASLINGCGKAKKWVLLAQYKDPLKLNDKVFKDIALQASNNKDIFSPSEEHVNLYYDGEYRGVYLLSEKNEVGSNRININDMEDDYEEREEAEGNIYGENINISSAANSYGNTYYYQEGLAESQNKGGYLLDTNNTEGDELNWFKYICNGTEYAINVKSPELGSKEDVKYISEYFQEFCDAVCATEGGLHTGRNPETGKYYYEYCDFDSLVDTYLIQTISSNADAFVRSLFFYKDSGEKMFAGPVWDMDLTLGMAMALTIDPDTDWIKDAPIAGDLIMIPEFQQALKERYVSIYEPILTKLITDTGAPDSYRSYGENIKASLAMDWIVWPDRYITGNGFVKWKETESYEDIVDYRIRWLTRHKAFLDSYFGVEKNDSDNNIAADGSADDSYKDTVTSAKNTKISGFKISALHNRIVRLKWSKTPRACKYKVQYSTNNKFRKAKNKTVTSCKLTLKELKKGKIYYFRVRPVINVVNKATNKKAAIYGKWTKSRKVRVKN